MIDIGIFQPYQSRWRDVIGFLSFECLAHVWSEVDLLSTKQEQLICHARKALYAYIGDAPNILFMDCDPNRMTDIFGGFVRQVEGTLGTEEANLFITQCYQRLIYPMSVNDLLFGWRLAFRDLASPAPEAGTTASLAASLGERKYMSLVLEAKRLFIWEFLPKLENGEFSETDKKLAPLVLRPVDEFGNEVPLDFSAFAIPVEHYRFIRWWKQHVVTEFVPFEIEIIVNWLEQYETSFMPAFTLNQFPAARALLQVEWLGQASTCN